jgi:hypothetical protein
LLVEEKTGDRKRLPADSGAPCWRGKVSARKRDENTLRAYNSQHKKTSRKM